MKMDERIQQLLASGWELHEIVTYEIVDPDGVMQARGRDKNRLWEEIIAVLDRQKAEQDAASALQEEKFRQAQLVVELWNAKVTGKKASKPAPADVAE